MRVSYDEMVSVFVKVLDKHGLHGDDGVRCATLFADASRDGVYSHGLNRFPSFIDSIEKGYVDITKRAVKRLSMGCFERWDGQKGPGPLNAAISMKRAVEISKEYCIGAVALGNTNHWMRAGNYGLMAVENDCIGILWTNTMQNMAPWGGKESKIGNNPIVFAIPHGDDPVLLDCAMSMFSYGKLDVLSRRGKEADVDAGYDRNGRLTRNPGEVLETRQVLPMGYWKGSGLSIVLDLIASTLAGGRSTSDIGPSLETEVSQFFMAIDLSRFPDRKEIDERIEHTLRDIRSSIPRDPSFPVRVPGDGVRKTRERSIQEGVLVDEEIWRMVSEM